MTFCNFLASPRLISKRQFSALSSLKTTTDSRREKNLNVRKNLGKEQLTWSESYRLWKVHPTSDSTSHSGSTFTAYKNDNQVSQRQLKVQDWWSSGLNVTNKEQPVRFKNNQYNDGHSRKVLNDHISGTKDHFDSHRRQGKLLDPKRQFGELRNKLNLILFHEYTSGVNNLKTILEWANQMRQNNVEETPLLNLIDRLVFKSEYHSLIPPIYYAFMRSSEVEKFINRAEILFPAVVHMFEAKNPEDKIQAFNQIQSVLKSTNFNKQSEYTRLLTYFIQFKLNGFIYQFRNKLDKGQLNALQIEEVASTIRPLGSCCPSPLADSLDYISRYKLGSECTLHIYKAFLGEPLERNLFADRTHIFFPWMLEILKEKESTNLPNKTWANVLDNLIRLDILSLGLPYFMVITLRTQLGDLFSYACYNGHFDIAQNVWNYCEIKNIQHQFSVYPLFLFAIYNWMNKGKNSARNVLYVLNSRIEFKRTSENYSELILNKEIKEWMNVRDRFLKINGCYKDIMENPQAKEKTKKLCSKILNGFVIDFINKNRK